MLRTSVWVVVVTFAAAATAGAAAAGDELAAVVDDPRQVALAAEVGLTGGGGATPGGLRVGGHYLYRLADHDWFDSGLAFTFGGRGDACVGDVMTAAGAPPCTRAVSDGFAGDLVLGLRRELTPRQGFTPFVRLAGFARVLRFDDVAGVAAGGELGAGVRAPIGRGVAVLAGAHGFVGAAHLDGAGGGRQLGLAVTVGAELGMR